MPVTHLTFDCYGTLIDWRGGIEKHLGDLLRKKGLVNERVFPRYVKLEVEEEGSYKKYRRVLSNTAMRVAESFGLELSKGEADEFAGSVPIWAPFGDTVKALEKLGDLGYKRIILSNIDSDILSETIRRNSLRVDGFITAEEIGSYKPAFGHWTSFFQKYGVKKSNVLHVAQSIYHDIIPATKLGIATAWINRYSEARPEVTSTFTFGTLEELTEFLEPSRA